MIPVLSRIELAVRSNKCNLASLPFVQLCKPVSAKQDTTFQAQMPCPTTLISPVDIFGDLHSCHPPPPSCHETVLSWPAPSHLVEDSNQQIGFSSIHHAVYRDSKGVQHVIAE